MYTGEEIAEAMRQMGVSHVVWLPDSTLGQWEAALRQTDGLRVVPVCREGEAWGVAAGLYLGGANPLVMIQCTGLFESGDALRNALHDYRLPLFAVVGYRSYLNQETLPGDTCLTFTEPVLQAWKIDYRLIDSPEKKPELCRHYFDCSRRGVPGVALLAEGKA